MSEIEKIKRYIARTGVKYTDTTTYQMKFSEMSELAKANGRVDAVVLAFEYGRAKGCRAAKAEQRKAVR